MNRKISFSLFVFLNLLAIKLFASGCCKLNIQNLDEHRINCISFSAASCMAATVTIGFATVAVANSSVPALCIGNSIAAGCTGCTSCILMGCAVRHYTLIQVSQQQRSENLQRLLVPSQQSMVLSPDSRQERADFAFSPISDT